MKRAWLVPALLLGCAAPPPPLEKPVISRVPAALIAESGASLYVFEGPEGWWRTVSEERRISLAVLKELLRHGVTHKSVILVGHGDFMVTEGFPAEITLFNPDSEAHKPRSGSDHTGFRISIKAAASKIPATCDLDVKAERLTDRVKRNREVQRDIEELQQGSSQLTLGEGILIPGGASKEGREFTLVLRVVSLEEP